jgi:DNA polymerase elongation subunit (family B)
MSSIHLDEWQPPAHKLHNRTIKYNQISQIPDRNGYLFPISFKNVDENIRNAKDLLFMPNYVHETHIQDKMYDKATYKIVLWGVLEDGRRATVILNGIQPYFEVLIPDLSDEERGDFAQDLYNELCGQSKMEPIKFEIHTGKQFKYFKKEKNYYIRFYFWKSTFRKNAIKYVREQKDLSTVHDDLTCYYRVVCRDRFMSFTSWNVLSKYTVCTNKSLKGSVFNVDIPVGYTKYEGNISSDPNLSKDKTMTMTWDIETYSPDGQLPRPENPEHKMFMIGMTFQWFHSTEYLLKVCLVDKPCEPHKDYLTIVCESEERVIKAFGKLFQKMKPELLMGFNDSDYDWPWLVIRASQTPNLLVYLAKCMDFTIPWRPYNDADILKYNFTMDKVKVEADSYAEGRTLQFPGYINLDVRTIFRQLYPTAEKSSLNWFLQANKMACKKDMPYQEMFKIYRRMDRIMIDENANHTDEEDENEFAVKIRKCKIVDDFAELMKEVAEYCVIDAMRCHELMKIRFAIMDRREVSAVAYTSLYEAFYRANGSKVRNLVIARGQKLGLKISNITDYDINIPEGKYPGGFVFAPRKGLVTSKLTMRERRIKAHQYQESGELTCELKQWLDITDAEIEMYEEFISNYTMHVSFETDDPHTAILNALSKDHIPDCIKKFFMEITGRPITGLDFSSLYPSLIMTYNLSPEYIVLKKQHARQLHEEGYKLHRIEFEMGGRTFKAWSVGHENKMDPSKSDYRFGIYPAILKELFDARNSMKVGLHHWESQKEEMEGMPSAEFNLLENFNKYENIVFQFNVIDSKQKALKVFMNTFYGETGNKRSPFFLLELAGGITSKGQLNVKSAHRIVTEYGCNTWYGDSVTEDTPVLIRDGEIIKYMEIQDLVKDYKLQDNGKEVANTHFEVWSDSGWTKIQKVIRHKTTKKIFRVLTHTGVVDCTEDHSLLNNEKTKVKPEDLKVGDELLHYPLPSITQEIDTITKEEAFIWGTFVGGGLCCLYKTQPGTKDIWTLNNQNKNLLKRCQKYLKNMGIKTKILEPHESSKIYKLILVENEYGSVAKILKYFRGHCYNKKFKIVPIQILQSSEEVRSEFFKGYCYAYGEKNSCVRTGAKKSEIVLKQFNVKNKITAMSFFMLVKSLGYNCSIDTIFNRLDIYKLTISKKSFQKSPIKIKKIEDLGSNLKYVYDLETSSHHFSAGVGELVVHNTDSIYLAMPNTAFLEIDRKYYSGKIPKLEYWEELVKITFKEIKPVQNMVNDWFLRDNGTQFLRMAYEEALFPVAFLAKKKYYGIPHISTPNFNYKYLFIRGLEVKKRGVSQFLRDVCNGIMNKSVSPENTNSLMELVHTTIHTIYKSEYNFTDFIMTDVFKPNKQNVKVQTFARRMSERGVKVKPWNRFNYVIVEKNPYFYDYRGRKQSFQVGDKMEYPETAQELGMKIDLDYYMQGSINGQLARLVIYHPLFHVEPDDDTQDASEVAEKKIYSNAGKYIDNYCKSYYTNYQSKGKIYQKVFKIANKVVNAKLKEVVDSVGIVDLIGSPCDLEKLDSWLCEKAEKVAIKDSKGYGQLYVEDQLQKAVEAKQNLCESKDSNDSDTGESNASGRIKKNKSQELQNVYFANKSNILKERESQFNQRSDILKRNIRENLTGIQSLYSTNQNMIETISNQIKNIIQIDDKFNDSKSEVPIWENIIEIKNINETDLNETMNQKIEELMKNTSFWKAVGKMKFIYINLVSNYTFIHKTRSIVDYLKICRNRESHTYLGKGFDKKTYISNSVNDMIGKETF